MTKQERADFIRKKLQKLYPKPKPPLEFKILSLFDSSVAMRNVPMKE